MLGDALRSAVSYNLKTRLLGRATMGGVKSELETMTGNMLLIAECSLVKLIVKVRFQSRFG